MNETAIINAALAALNAILGVIGEIRGQNGQNDDAILAAAQNTVSANDAFYAKVVAALATPPAPAAK
jgi:hypothetical protein